MAKINRYNGDLPAFADQAQGTERTVFGSTTQDDTLDANITADFQRGWGIVGVNENPTKQDFNGLAYTLSQVLAYLHQMGVAEWNASQEYFDGSVVVQSNNIYQLVSGGDGSVDPASDDGTNWRKVTAPFSVQTISELSGIANPADGDQILVFGEPFRYNGSSWVALDEVTPEAYGAVGDGVADDTAAVEAWWEAAGINKKARGKYLITGTSDFLHTTGANDFYADLIGAEFVVSANRGYLFRVSINTAGVNCLIFGGKVTGGDSVARPLDISTSAVTAGTIWVRDFLAIDVFANTGLAYTSSAIGISVACEASYVAVEHCRIDGVNRGYVDPGIVASVGISVDQIIGSAFIQKNVVVDVRSPAGDEDADGLSIFSRDRLLAGRQQVDIDISGNRLYGCKGRFIKLQTTGADVFDNRMESRSGEIVSDFRAIDCQFGGNNIHNNFWDLYAGVTGGTNAVFLFSYFKSVGNWESQTVCRNNFLVLEREIRYFASVLVNGGYAQVNIADNYVKQEQSTSFINNAFTRLETEDLTSVNGCRIEVKRNTYPASRDPVIQLVGDEFSTDSSAATKFSYEVVGNRNNTVGTFSAQDKVIELVAADITPHINDVVIRGNETQAVERLNAKSLNLNLLPVGGNFYYGTDGGAGGMTNAATGYDRFVHVVAGANYQELGINNTSTFARRRNGETQWYEFTGTAL